MLTEVIQFVGLAAVALVVVLRVSTKRRDRKANAESAQRAPSGRSDDPRL